MPYFGWVFPLSLRLSSFGHRSGFTYVRELFWGGSGMNCKFIGGGGYAEGIRVSVRLSLGTTFARQLACFLADLPVCVHICFYVLV